MIPYALKFTNTNDVVNVPASTSLNMVTQFAAAAWVQPTGSGNKRVYALNDQNAMTIGDVASGQMIIDIVRTVTSADAAATLSNFTAFRTGIPLFVYGQLDINTAANNKLMIGNLQVAATEPSSYVIQRAGSGTFPAPLAITNAIGNRPVVAGGGRPMTDFMWSLGIWTSLPSIDQIHQLQEHTNPSRFNTHPLYNPKGYWILAQNGTGPVIDISGNGNHGTLSGPVPTNNCLPRV